MTVDFECLQQGFILAAAGAPPLQQIDLQQVHRVRIGVAQAYVATQGVLVLEQILLLFQVQDQRRGQFKLLLDLLVHRLQRASASAA